MAQQAPLSRSLSVQNTLENPLTLADGFKGSSSVTATTFAVDPDFRVGTAQNWTPFDSTGPACSHAILALLYRCKGNACTAAHSPEYLSLWGQQRLRRVSDGVCLSDVGGSSNRNAGTVEIRHGNATAFKQASSTPMRRRDKTMQGWAVTPSLNWLDRKAERALSNFDQRHVIAVQGQYTSGSFTRLGFWGGWRGKLFREWTLTSGTVRR